MKILVCGGAGYIGSHMVKMLLRRGHAVAVLDDLSKGYRDAVLTDQFFRVNLADFDAVNDVLASRHFDAVLHFAAFIRVQESVTEPGKYFRNNFCNTLNLLDAMVRHDVRWFIFSSTAAVYGEPRYVPIDEKHSRKPINPYGASKQMVEDALNFYSSVHHLRWASLRYFNAAGADPECEIGPRHNPVSHLIPFVLRAAAGIDPHVRVFGRDYPTRDGTAIRDYIHVMDLCEAHVAALDYLVDGGESRAFNIGVGRGYGVQEVIDSARRVTGRDFDVISAPRRVGDPAVLVANPGLANRVLGWKARHEDIDEIIADHWAWQLKMLAEAK